MVGFYENLIKRFFRVGTSFMLGAMVFAVLPSPSVQAAETLFPYLQTYKISAYYSPCPGQARYATGTYEGDIRLNGNGTNGADGTPVYPGMIAAPKTYPFGTKMSIPGIGIVAVHDRGGAIVPAGERDQAYDRLDVWMGACDEGLYRALTWGVRTVEVTVYGIDDSMEESVYLEGFSYVEQVVNQVIVTPTLLLPEDVWYLSTGEDVERLQTYLQQLGYYQGGITGTYGDETRDAVFAFQVSQGILDSWDDFGAGHTGINTRKMLDLAISKWRENEQSQSFQRYQEGLLLLSQYPDLDRNRTPFSQDLALGSSGAEVSRLQEELKNLGYLRIEPTGYFGEVTQHALFKFQQKRGILLADTDSGAGVFGPQTRSAFNAIVEARTQHLSLIALGRHEQVLAGQSSAPATAEDMNNLSSVLALGDRGSDVKLLQTLLKNLGFFNGAFVTEFYGEQTKAAVVAFQLANGLIASESDAEAGVVNEATRSLLNQLS